MSATEGSQHTAGRSTVRRFGTVGVVMALAGAMSGCLVKDVTHTWYVEPAGAVTWVVEEKDVRSDAKAPGDRQQEEAVYWLAVQQDRHPMAAGLREIGGDQLRILTLRSQPPYSVMTEARFSGLDVLGQRLITASGLGGASTMANDGPAWEWTMVVRDPSVLDPRFEPSEGVGALLDTLESLRVVLAGGRFERAEGFRLSDDRRVATFTTGPEQPTDEEPTITLRLVWKSE